MEELNSIGGHIQVALRSLAEDASAARSLRLSGHSDRISSIADRHVSNRELLNRLIGKYLKIVQSETEPKPEG